MNAVVLISTAILGQCSGGQCVAPSFVGGFPAEPLFVLSAPAEVRDYGWLPIVHEGLHIKVWGYMRNGKVRWNPSFPANVRAIELGRQRAAGLARHQVEPAPSPKSRPEPEGDLPVKQDVGQALNFGLSPDRLGKKSEYTAHSDEARRFVEEARGEADDAGKLHVTVIGTADDCARVVNDIRTSPAFALIRDRLLVQEYRPDEWAVDPALGFKTDGKPSILVQQARGPRDPNGGRVLYRAMDYSAGPEALAEAIRRADPAYKPERDPGPATGRSGGACPLGFTRDHWPSILVVGIGLAALHFRPRKESRP